MADAYHITLKKARKFIMRCKNELKWEDLSKEVVMDIGCGIFQCSRAVFETFPEVGCVLAIDKNPDLMTNEIREHEFFKDRFRDLFLQFHAVDILDSPGLVRFKGLIDKIVCRATFHQIDDKMTAFRNIYDLLKPGGHAGIAFCLSHPVGFWQSRICEHENWRQYRSNVAYSFYPSNLEEDYYRNVLDDLGFLVVLCEKKSSQYAYRNEEYCLEELMSIGLELLNIPQERMAEFRQESINIFKEMIGQSGDGPLRYHISELFLLVIK